jgi:hypothetical protein
LDLTPSFKCYELENSLARIDHIIPICDSKVHVLIDFEALVPTRAQVIADIA